MNAKSIIKDIKSYADPSRAKELQRYFKTGKGEYGEGDIFIGLTVPQTRSLARTHQQASLETIAELLKSPIHEIRLCALLILVQQFSKVLEEDQERIVRFYLRHKKYINNWDLVDLSAPSILGSYALRSHDYGLINKLIKSKRLWDRRIGMLSTFPFIKKGKVDIVYRFAIILMDDPEDLMHKAAGWMLRVAGKRDPERLLTFTQKNAKRMPRTMLRYAIEKFPPKKRKELLSL
ncbi:DNA alkylation repair protein [Peredibacter starrii]|uniref:DNA alkylation repair protein n=1 Tax=Peredibacter starrii TaxID=28202 RepID=A0AAX4HMF1_9BACT|nr:DNA alkylation repair protein [Peredibacter starrii]WPU64343.1 DNA alkylation repair protein [Peredibacter starrii]